LNDNFPKKSPFPGIITYNQNLEITVDFYYTFAGQRNKLKWVKYRATRFFNEYKYISPISIKNSKLLKNIIQTRYSKQKLFQKHSISIIKKITKLNYFF